MADIQKVGVIVPAYDVEPWIRGVLDGVLRFIPSGRVYVVDDGSRDRTCDVAARMGVTVIRHPFNRGKGEALKSGFRAAVKDGLEAVITLDGDAQHDPRFIPNFLSAMEESGSGLVLGTRRFHFNTMPVDRIFSNRMSSLMVSVFAGKRIFDSQCGYRMVRTGALKGLELWTGHYETETELLIKLARRGCRVGFCPVPVVHSPGSSHIRRFRDTVRFCSLLMRLLADGK